MPVTALKNLADKAGISMEKAEKYWESAKETVKKEFGLTEEDDNFYARVMGVWKQYLRGKLKEETEVADIPNLEVPFRDPDGVGPYGHPSFDYEGDDLPISKVLDGKERYGRWEKHIPDKGIVNWARKNPFKSFYLKAKNGVHFKVR